MPAGLPYTGGDAVADLHRIADSTKGVTPFLRGAALICFEAERKARVPIHEAFNVALDAMKGVRRG